MTGVSDLARRGHSRGPKDHLICDSELRLVIWTAEEETRKGRGSNGHHEP